MAAPSAFLLLLFLLPLSYPQVTSTPALWSGSDLYQTGSISVTVSAKTGTVTYNYLKAFSVNTLQACLGYQSMTQTSQGTTFEIAITNNNNGLKNKTGAIMSYTIGSSTAITAFVVRWLAISSSVTGLSTYDNVDLYSLSKMNNTASGTGTRSLVYNVNFTNTTGVELIITNVNIMLLFVETLKMKTISGGKYQFSTAVKVLNKNIYSINLTAYGNTTISQYCYSRMIYDQTRIQSSQTTYLDGGELYSNTDYAPLGRVFTYSNTSSFMVGLSYFCAPVTQALNWNFNVNTIQTTGTFVFTQMSIAYWNYRYRTCPATHTYFNESDSMCYNQCDKYYFPNNTNVSSKTCDPCYYACESCTSNSSSACTACSSTDNRQMSGSNTCDCLPGYYENGTSACAQCSYTCVTCSSATICLTCPGGTGRTLQSGQCLCPPGTVDTGTAACGTCNDAIPGCQTCTAAGTSVTCTLCDPAQNLALKDGKCVCKTGYANKTSINQCQLCSVLIWGCIACSDQNTCTQCSASNNLYLNNSICVCTTGYYNNSGTCALCSARQIGCVACTDTVCTACKSTGGFYLNNGNCACPSGQFPQDVAGTAVCSPCSSIPGCLTCDNATNCTGCDPLLHLTVDSGSGGCVCASGFYNDTTSCAPCSYGCTACTSLTSCSSCNYPLVPISGYCVCDNGYYAVGQDCQFCFVAMPGCTNCTSSTACSLSSCDTALGFIPDGSGGCECNSGYYLNGQLCTPCMAVCATCSGGSTCDTCVSGLPPSGGSCDCTSPSVPDPTGNTCVSCSMYSIGCVACTVNPFQCSDCSGISGMIINASSGYCICGPAAPYYTASTASCDATSPSTLCGVNEYDNGGTCTACSITYPNCTTCDGSQCFSCDSLNASVYYQSGACLLCSPGCSVCLDGISCLSCSSGFILMGTDCVCSNGYVDDSGVCKECYFQEAGCQQCDPTQTSPPRCLACIAAYFVLDPATGTCKCSDPTKFPKDQQCDPCPLAGCLSCIDNTACQTCDNATNWISDGANGCKCKDGFFINSASCVPCSSGCTSCTDVTNCASCDDSKHYVVNADNTACICKNGYYMDGVGVCQPCSAGCLTCDIVSCSFCNATSHFVMDPNTQQCICDDGYYFDSVTTQNCQPCSTKYIGCVNCTDTQCNACNTSIYTLDTSSIPPVCECNPGLYYNGITCASCAALFNGCVECDPSNCTLCDASTHYIWTAGPPTYTTGGCDCDPLYIAYKGKCELCETIIIGCQLCNSPTICGTCKVSDQFVLTPNGSCICDVGYYLDVVTDPANPACPTCGSAMLGCLQCTSSTFCTLCNFSDHFQLNVVTNQCDCEINYFVVGTVCMNCSTSCLCPGYYWEGPSCVTRCGDDVLIYDTEECDDGNLINNDGCSSTCQVQDGFSCTTVGIGTTCSYAQPINLTIVQFTKDPLCNCLIFTFSVGPSNISTLDNLNFSNVVSSNLPLYNGTFTYSNGKLVLTYQYNQTLEESNATFYFTPYLDPSFIQTPGSTEELKLILPSNEPIVVYNDEVYQQRVITTKALLAAQVISYLVFFVGLFCNKIVGLEMMGVLQIAFFILADLKLVNPLLAPLLYMKSVNGFNVEMASKGAEVPIRISAMSYKSLFLNNFNIMMILPLLSLLAALILYLVGKFKPGSERLIKISKHMLKQAFLTATVFSLYNLSFSAGLQFLYKSNDPTEAVNTLVAVLSLCLPISVMVLLTWTRSAEFGEFKNKFHDEFMSRHYFVISISYRMLLGFLIAYQNAYPTITIINVFLSILFLMYLWVNTPFRAGYQNYRAFIAELSTLTILSVGMYYRSMKANSQLQTRSQILAPAILQLVMIFLCIGVSVGCLAYEMYLKVRRYLNKEGMKEVVVFQSIDSIVKESESEAQGQ